MERVLAVLGDGGVVRDGRVTLAADDLGLGRGESVFEGIRIYGGHAFRLAEHVDRMLASAAAVGVHLDAGAVRALAGRAEAAAGGQDASLRIFATKGTEAAGGKGVLFAIVGAIPDGLDELRERGATGTLVTLAADPLARAAAPWLLPGVKSTSYAVNMAAKRAADARGADEAIFVGLGEEVLEGPTANVWWRTGDLLCTPALELGVLAGVTRAAVLDLAGGCGYRASEGTFTAAALRDADEAFLSSTVREIVPLVGVDGHTIGDGRPGPAARSLQTALRALAHAEAERGPAAPGTAAPAPVGSSVQGRSPLAG